MKFTPQVSTTKSRGLRRATLCVVAGAALAITPLLALPAMPATAPAAEAAADSWTRETKRPS